MAPRLRTALPGIALTALLVLGLPGTPAGAVTYTFPHIHAGTVDLYDSSDTYKRTWDLGAACQQSTSYTFSGGSSGTYSASTLLKLDDGTSIIEITLVQAGAYASNDMSSTASLTAIVRTRNAACNHDNVVDCTVNIDGIALTGTLDDNGHGVTGLTGGHWTAGGDHVELAGSSSPFSILVSGAGCGGGAGGLVALNDGYVVVPGLIWDGF